MTRAEHLQWAKDRALGYIEDGDTVGAYQSMASDLLKHEETASHPAIQLGMMLMMTGKLSSAQAMHDFIEGFN